MIQLGISNKDQQMSPKRVLLVGYNGANNTGAEARLLTIIEDVRAVLGPETHITVPTLNEANLRRYLEETSTLRIVPIPTIYPFALRRLVKAHDLVLLVEGSTYMDTWGSALLWAFLWVTRCAHAMGKPCLAYAVDAGDLSALNQRLVRRVASQTDLIITRNQPAADRLRSWGVAAPVQVSADTAFYFHTESADKGLIQRVWPQATTGIVGMSVVDFYLWPVVMRLWGREEDCYRWPFYFSRSPERRRASDELARGYAALADSVVKDHDKRVALICMEEVDEPLARQVRCYMTCADRARVFSSREYNASQLTVLLRDLDLLVTSRYHAGVLSLAAQVPQVAVGHDRRLEFLYREMGLEDRFFIRPTSPRLFETLKERVERLLTEPGLVQEALRRGYEEQLMRAKRNRQLLESLVKVHGLVGIASSKDRWEQHAVEAPGWGGIV